MSLIQIIVNCFIFESLKAKQRIKNFKGYTFFANKSSLQIQTQQIFLKQKISFDIQLEVKYL
mgnify:CR=1 FL=1